MLKIKELPWAPTVALLLDPAARVRPPVRVCPPANAPSGSGPDNLYTSKQKCPYICFRIIKCRVTWVVIQFFRDGPFEIHVALIHADRDRLSAWFVSCQFNSDVSQLGVYDWEIFYGR